ncbi:hypothetical protein D1B33_07970 [Lysinibacillus yapensis]|uniref:Uncharacterized protein n=1 Tax=Ureibacillus yapensis TaxID=2304605 RepID=A0A396S8P7_9BACL|nr:hypothetical protein [Lysinibacillus yapensis]RHW37469.1 hypothetical protein D1B33_07970 [Lysinibacillus yapensis]
MDLNPVWTIFNKVYEELMIYNRKNLVSTIYKNNHPSDVLQRLKEELDYSRIQYYETEDHLVCYLTLAQRLFAEKLYPEEAVAEYEAAKREEQTYMLEQAMMQCN